MPIHKFITTITMSNIDKSEIFSNNKEAAHLSNGEGFVLGKGRSNLWYFLAY